MNNTKCYLTAVLSKDRQTEGTKDYRRLKRDADTGRGTAWRKSNRNT